MPIKVTSPCIDQRRMNGMQETLEQLSLPISPKPMCTVSDFRARVSALLDSDTVSKIREGLSFLKSCGLLKSESLNIYSLRMSQDSSAMMGGGTFETILGTMEELGYGVEWQVLNSKYFVPQNRERVYIVGHLGGLSGREIFPITANSGQADELQGQRDRVIANTLLNGDRESVGIYPIESGGGAQSKRIPQGLNAGRSTKVKPMKTEIAAPLCARDYKGVRNREASTVVIYEDTNIGK